MDEIFFYFRDNLPVWLVFVILLIVGVVKYGAKFLNEIIEVADNYAQKSDAVKNEYIAFLKKNNDNMAKEIGSLKNEIAELRKKIDER